MGPREAQVIASRALQHKYEWTWNDQRAMSNTGALDCKRTITPRYRIKPTKMPQWTPRVALKGRRASVDLVSFSKVP
jgi:hypothetical protein